MPTAQINTPILLQITVLSPEKILFTGQAEALTCKNKKGEFDILPLHSNFISLINEYIILHLLNGKTQRINIGSGLLKAIENNVTILLNIDLGEQDIVFKALFQQLESSRKS